MYKPRYHIAQMATYPEGHPDHPDSNPDRFQLGINISKLGDYQETILRLSDAIFPSQCPNPQCGLSFYMRAAGNNGCDLCKPIVDPFERKTTGKDGKPYAGPNQITAYFNADYDSKVCLREFLTYKRMLKNPWPRSGFIYAASISLYYEDEEYRNEISLTLCQIYLDGLNLRTRDCLAPDPRLLGNYPVQLAKVRQILDILLEYGPNTTSYPNIAEQDISIPTLEELEEKRGENSDEEEEDEDDSREDAISRKTISRPTFTRRLP